MKATRRILPEVELCHLAAAMRKTLSPKELMALLVLLGGLLTLVPAGFAQAPNPPLNFGNNFFVTGDYIVAGANGMTTNFTTINGVTHAVGTITVPDSNPGITGTKQVPPGAQIVAALLYWQTAEKVGVTAGSTGSGQNGYFRPLLHSKSGGPVAPGYAISGTNVSASTNVSWSSGGCTGGSTGKVLRTYRADVAGALPLDANGNPTANTSFEVRLPSVGNSTPLTLGATLVVIYRIPSGAGGPSIPLNSIVIYDGDYSQGSAQLIMTQNLQGFYDADQNPVSRLTHIVGSGQTNKFQTVYLSSGTNGFVKLPFLYGNKLPAFPGWYGTWDNPTWTFTNASTKNPGVVEDASSATTQVVPSMSNQGCVSWGAVIVSTTVKNSDHDGILDSWKANQGYCDVSINASCSKGDPAWVDLTGAVPGEKDIFLQYDYMCSKVQGPASSPNSCAVAPNGDYSFDPRLAVDPADMKTAADKVVDAFNNHIGSPKSFALHAVPGNAIAESQSAVTCTDSAQSGATCPFPNEPGTVGFREGLTYIKNQNINPTTGVICNPGDTGCAPIFQHGKKDSYHYALFSHGVGLPNWFLSDPTSLTSVKQSANTVTFTTPTPHGVAHIAGDFCTSGRVTVVFAITNPNLNGTYCIKNVTPTTFQIAVGGSATNFTYTSKTDPNLAVANGQVTSMSGFSDVGGQNSVISLGEGAWGPASNPASDGNKWQTKAGTFMHELGHTLGLTHGGTFYNNLANNDYTPHFETNCKPNVQSSMSYLFQVDLLEKPNQLDPHGQPLMVVDYSEAALPTLTENSPQAAGLLSNTAYAKTAWFQLTKFAGGAPVSPHCDGSPVGSNEQSYSYVTDFVSNLFWSSATGEDINFDGSSTDVLHGHDEWDGTVQNGVVPSPGVDLEQISAVGTITTIGLGGEAGALRPAGGGGALHPAGGGGALKPAGGGGALKPAGGGGLTGEITHEAANSYARPPRDLTIAQEEASPRLIDLSWFAPTFGQIENYNIYRSAAGGPFTQIHSNPGTQTTYQDTVNCNAGGYSYRVTAVTTNDAGNPQESSPSNTVPATGEPLLRGCYSVGTFSAPASSTQGSSLQVSWALTDDFYTTPPAAWAQASSGNPVTRQAANTLVAIGPLPGNCTTAGRTTLVTGGSPTSGVDRFTNDNSNQFTFTWNNTDAFCAGQYTFELDLDSGQKFMSTGSQLQIDVNDTDTNPHITTLSLPVATVGVSYANSLFEDGGVGTVSWSLDASSGPLPSGITLSSSGTLSGTPLVPPPGQLNFTSQLYSFTVKVSDSAGNVGTQALTLRLITPVSLNRNDSAVGTNPIGVISADFNNDGKLDLATANGGDGTVSILLGNGDGTLTPQTALIAGGSPYSLAAGDFNADGKLDLVVTNLGDGTISVFLGNGDGTFLPGVTYSVGSTPSSVVIGDFNKDGFVDLAVANQDSNNHGSVSILLGNSDGTFQPAVFYQAGTTDVGTVAAGDFNGDGNLDLALTNPSADTVSILLGNGDGSFNAAVTSASGNSGDHPIAVTPFDFNGDGKLDLAVTNFNAETVAILIGNGDGTFKPRVTYPTTLVPFRGPSAMTTADLNADGKVDLIITNQFGNSGVSILLGNGDGTFQSPLEFTTGKFASGVTAGDFNGDGRLDLAVANHDDNTISVMLHLPQPPTNLATTNVTSSQVTLAWTASTSTNVTGYNVYQATTSGGPYSKLNSTVVVGASFTDTTVTTGTTYYYVVTAVDANNLESVNSNQASATTP